MSLNLNVHQQEKEDIDLSSKGEIAKYIMDKMHNQVSGEMTEEDKTKMNTRIEQKLKSGKKLSKKEEQYLKETNPQLYMHYMRIRARAESMAEQLKHAKTKQQANTIIMTSTASVSDKDPYKEYVLAAMYKEADDYKSTRAYQKLPDTDAELKKKKHVKANDDCKKNNEDEDSDEDFDPMAWSPLQEVIDSMPKFDMPA